MSPVSALIVTMKQYNRMADCHVLFRTVCQTNLEATVMGYPSFQKQLYYQIFIFLVQWYTFHCALLIYQSEPHFQAC